MKHINVLLPPDIARGLADHQRKLACTQSQALRDLLRVGLGLETDPNRRGWHEGRLEGAQEVRLHMSEAMKG